MNFLALRNDTGVSREVSLYLTWAVVDMEVGSSAHGRYSNINQCATFHPTMKPASHINARRAMRTIFNSRSSLINSLPSRA